MQALPRRDPIGRCEKFPRKTNQLTKVVKGKPLIVGGEGKSAFSVLGRPSHPSVLDQISAKSLEQPGPDQGVGSSADSGKREVGALGHVEERMAAIGEV